MQRMQLVELEDLPWMPAAIRDGGTDLLDLAFDRLGFYREVVPKLEALLDRTRCTQVVDVCSGGGGGALYAIRALRDAGREDVRFVLTDRYPNEAGRARVAERNDAKLVYREDPVDALAVPPELDGVRTMWGALHHFPPEAVTALVASIVRDQKPLGFFDVAASKTIRGLPTVLAPVAMGINIATLFVGSFVLVPFVRPLRASRWALTYLVPLIPTLVAWDGTVSAIRAYAPDELLAIARSVPGGDAYDWDAGVAGSALYFTGCPRAS
ncbi:class I SAM-dependent methyltransferase [Polyangium jinanense]|uniref:Class I SAM-dependent methyltransferase n=1 Tax=Polyangium jinanense TaxID=2829994 RepID=A0A9X4AYA3_9BACT|nr:class I SAM-dependent methyltransferase [Polyangium jinanense]MDC3961391.1 class I SAM-dependent methyltransferase [Polyangium jinanense]MDC3986992.1 class I SAM-dependent methyltransferase [Polyangium jinanense]